MASKYFYRNFLIFFLLWSFSQAPAQNSMTDKFRIGLTSSSHMLLNAFMLHPELQYSRTDQFEMRISAGYHSASKKIEFNETFLAKGVFGKFGVGPIFQLDSDRSLVLRPGFEYTYSQVTTESVYSFLGVFFEDAEFKRSFSTIGHGLTVYASLLKMISPKWFIDVSPRFNVFLIDNRVQAIPALHFAPGLGYTERNWDITLQVGRTF